jgi:hypothetical protein
LEILGGEYMTITTFQRRVTPLREVELEDTYNGNSIEYEDFSTDLDVLGPLLHSLFQEHWQEVGLGHMVDGSVLELEFTAAPKICRIYDGYLTVVTESWHMHLCVSENQGGATGRTPEHLRQVRRVSRAALYRRLNADGEARSWGIQFWNGAGVKMMSLFLPNAFLGEGEDLLPEHKPDLAKLGLYEQLRQIYVLGTMDIPYETNCDFKHNLAETDNLCLTTPTTLTEKSSVLNHVHATFSKGNRLP